MERLTKKDRYGHWYTNEDVHDRMLGGEPYPHAYDGKPIDKLADYEDKQEQGLLIELPVAIGTEAWRIVEHSGGGRIPNWYEKYKVKFALYMLSDWGKTVVATEAEAESALAKMGGK